MRKINLFAVMTAVVATTFTACTNTEDVAMPEQKVLDFSVFANKNTRAAETGTTLKTDGKAFGVWGYSTFGTTVTDVFVNEDVKYNGTTSAWEYSPLKFWDSRSSYEFYAYYPYKDNGVTIDATSKNITVTDFTVASAVADHVDLMLAGKVARAAGSTSEVQFDFNHLLSNINLSFKKHAQIENTKVTLTSVKIYGMNQKGTFVQTQSPNFHSGTWTTSDMVALTGAVELANNNELASTTSVAFNDMLFIPQSTNTLKVDVNYILGDTGDEQPFSRTLDLSYDATDRPANPATWAQNQKITYNFTINADVIEFGDPTVVDWDTNQDVEVPTIQ